MGMTEQKAALRGTKAGVVQTTPIRTELDMASDELADLQDHPPEPEPEPEEIEPQDDGSVVVHLTHPLRPYSGKGTDLAAGMTKIVLRELYATDVIEMDKADGDFGKIQAVVKELSGLPVAILERLHFLDYAKLHGVVSDKLGNFLLASAKASSALRKS